MPYRLPVYTAAVLLGIATMLLVVPFAAIEGGGPGWTPPFPDQAQALTGHLGFQADAWRWPLLDTARLFWPHPISIALVDSNPLVSLAAKIWARSTGAPPANWLGAFMAACFLLQPVAGVYAARGLRVGPVAALVAGVLAAGWPALMNRMGHLNLCAHFLILLALGLTLRELADDSAERDTKRPSPLAGGGWERGTDPRRDARDTGKPYSGERNAGAGTWARAAALLAVAVLIHPYLFQLCAVVLAAIPLDAALRRRAGWRRAALLFVASGVLAVGLLTLLSGPIGGGEKGFTFFSMNLASPIWPQRSGVFGADLPIIDPTGGQAEGFNWLGAGVMFLLAAMAVRAAMRRAWPRPALGLALVLLGLFILSLSSRVYAGPVKLLDLGTKPWEDLFGSFRAPGRAFWPVGYAIMLGCVAAVDRMPRRVGGALLVAAAVLQVVDIGPLLDNARSGWTHGSRIATPAIPAGTTLFTVAPFAGCVPDQRTKARAPVMLLEAVRRGARLGDIGLGRSPKWFSCERILSDALELPLAPGETRAFFALAQAALRPDRLGAGADCRRVSDIILCGRDVALTEGAPLPSAAPAAPVTLPLALHGAALAAVLGTGWVTAPDGVVWSEGPRGTLVVPVAPGAALTVTLRASGVAGAPAATRPVETTIGRADGRGFVLSDDVASDVVLAVPASATRDGVLRVALDVVRPVDPAKRGMTAPVQRAAIRLFGVSIARTD